MKHSLLAFAIIAAGFTLACDKVPLTSPTGSTITLSASTAIVPVHGRATITATVIESAGTAVHNGTLVSFLADFGRLDPPEAYTVNGKASTTFIADGRSGSVAINALSGSATTQGSSSTSGGTTTTTPGRSITLLVGGAAAGRITARAEPSAVPQTGGTVQILTSVTDTNGNPLPGAPVVFSIAAATAGGTLGNGVLSSTSDITDTAGIARTSLTTNQATTVTATVATNLAAAVTANVSVSLITAPVITLTASAGPLVGIPVVFTLTPSTAATANPLTSVTIDFGDGTSQTVTGLTGPVGVTHTYTRANGYTVTATARDVNGTPGVSSIGIVVTRAQPTVTLTAPTTTVSLAAPTNGTASFSVAAALATGGPPIQSVVVKLADGTVLYSGTGGGAFTHRFTAAGSYVVQATVTDAAGTVAQASAVVVVQ